ncbi:MAG TPA: hypothetical protein ENH82_09950 [bacterium]|nr:hypothetical protein [bacterium]
MPYLTEDQKYEIEKQIELKHAAAYFASMSDENFAGSINYWNHVTCRTYINKKGIKYWRLALVVGTLLLTIFELVRRVVNPYEDKKMQPVEQGGNGDVEV